jgi:molybdopterin molybdotransferase
MITSQAAQSTIMAHVADWGTTTVPLADAVGAVLREDWFSDRPLPPFDRVTMDGIAVQYDAAVRLSQLPVAGVVAAGDPQAHLHDPHSCVEIMTGAVLPTGADTIVRYEDVTIEDGMATLHTELVRGQNVHRQGEDRPAGEWLAGPGTRLTAAHIGVAASIGKAEVRVSRAPRILVVSTGNELVEVSATPAPHQIRRSNVYALQAALRAAGYAADTAHIDDVESVLHTTLGTALAQYDVLLLSGGVSKGKFDYLPGVLSALGVQQHFHVVAQRPGKPFWFGTQPDTRTTVFALPGNPISSFMCLHVYVLDWLRASMGLPPPAVLPHARLTADVPFKPDLTYFLEAQVHTDAQGQWLATPRKGNGSGDLANLMNANAFIELPRGRDVFCAGEVYPVYLYGKG